MTNQQEYCARVAASCKEYIQAIGLDTNAGLKSGKSLERNNWLSRMICRKHGINKKHLVRIFECKRNI